MEREPDGSLITLLDEDGHEKEFEHLATLEYEGSTYVALIPAFMQPEELVDSDGELIILKVTEDDNGESLFSTIENDDEFHAVSREFETMLQSDFDIVEDDSESDTSDDD